MQPSGIWGQTPATRSLRPQAPTRRSLRRGAVHTRTSSECCEYYYEPTESRNKTANTANNQDPGHGHRSGRADSSIRSNPACNTHGATRVHPTLSGGTLGVAWPRGAPSAAPRFLPGPSLHLIPIDGPGTPTDNKTHLPAANTRTTLSNRTRGRAEPHLEPWLAGCRNKRTTCAARVIRPQPRSRMVLCRMVLHSRHGPGRWGLD